VRVVLSWSSGKDCAWALRALRQDPTTEVVGLLTTFNQAADRVAMHAVRRGLVRAQAQAAGLPLIEVELPWPCSNEAYESTMRDAVERIREGGAEGMAFGDLFLEDVRRYREQRLEGTGLQPLFPLWGQPTAELARTMVAEGLQAYVTCVDPGQLSARHAGLAFDESFLDALPESVDPCGERGEFHTFAWSGPMFSAPIPVRTGAVVTRDGFVYADLTPAESGPA
jgi:uncharacterized protein (TIGR00290 family)